MSNKFEKLLTAIPKDFDYLVEVYQLAFSDSLDEKDLAKLLKVAIETMEKPLTMRVKMKKIAEFYKIFPQKINLEWSKRNAKVSLEIHKEGEKIVEYSIEKPYKEKGKEIVYKIAIIVEERGGFPVVKLCKIRGEEKDCKEFSFTEEKYKQWIEAFRKRVNAFYQVAPKELFVE